MKQTGKLVSILLLSLLMLGFLPLQSLGQSPGHSNDIGNHRLLAGNAIKLAVGYLYVREITPNRSRDIDRFNRTAGAPVGSYWCASFVYTVADESCKKVGLQNPLLRTASVARQLKYAKQVGSGLRVLPASQAKKGDIFCMRHGGGTMQNVGQLWNGHTGFTTENYGNYQATIEGNTNKAGSRNGDRVAERERPTNSILAVIRWSDNVQINYTAQPAVLNSNIALVGFAETGTTSNTISCRGCLRTGTSSVGRWQENYSRFCTWGLSGGAAACGSAPGINDSSDTC